MTRNSISEEECLLTGHCIALQLEGFCIRSDTGTKILTEEEMFESVVARLHDEDYLKNMRTLRDQKIANSKRKLRHQKRRRKRRSKRQKADPSVRANDKLSI